MRKSHNLEILFFFIFGLNLVAQDKINPPKFEYFFPSNNYYQYINHANPPFILGWNWSTKGATLDNALKMNTYHEHYNPDWSKNAIQYTTANSYEPNFF